MRGPTAWRTVVAIGWVRRDTGWRRPELVAAWIVPRAAQASGVTLREVRKVVEVP